MVSGFFRFCVGLTRGSTVFLLLVLCALTLAFVTPLFLLLQLLLLLLLLLLLVATMAVVMMMVMMMQQLR